MNHVEAQFKKAEAKVNVARKKWQDLVEEQAAFEEAGLAAREIKQEAKSRKDSKSQQDEDDSAAVAFGFDMAKEAYQDSKKRTAAAEEALAKAKADLETLRPKYQRFCRRRDAEERKRAFNERFRGYHQRHDEQKTDEEEEESRNKRQRTDQPPPPPQKRAAPQSIHTKAIEDWHKACAAAFMSKPILAAFPEPPAEPCGIVSCNAEEGRALKACKCNIRKAFQGRRSRLKLDRFTFHPDRFAAVPEEVRETVQQAAKKVFVVVEAMYRGN